MSYAVYKDGDRISRPFQTPGDAWDCANDANAKREESCTVEPGQNGNWIRFRPLVRASRDYQPTIRREQFRFHGLVRA
jgi:hypothetical protein